MRALQTLQAELESGRRQGALPAALPEISRTKRQDDSPAGRSRATKRYNDVSQTSTWWRETEGERPEEHRKDSSELYNGNPTIRRASEMKSGK